MRERPIIFSAPMVRAILAGQKTQTRRLVKARKCPDFGCEMSPGEIAGDEDQQRLCPYGQPGDRLWVREAFRFPESLDDLSPRAVGEKAIAAGYGPAWCPTQYEADGTRQHGQEWRDFVTPPMPNEPGRIRNALHMPRWASRITLEITGIRVERLQDISASDALAEGVNVHHDHHAKPRTHICSPVQAYRDLWEAINGEGSWDANPWAWVVEFGRVEGGAA